MKGTKAADLRGKTAEELRALISDEKAAMYKHRRDLVFRRTTDSASYKVRRHNVARLLTILGEKERPQKEDAS